MTGCLALLLVNATTLQQPSHLQKWKRVTLTFEYEVAKGGYDITRIEAFAAKAPETGTQMNCSTEVTIRAKRAELSIPSSSLESKEELFKTSEGKQTGIFAQYRNKEKQTYQGGYVVTVRYKADLYHYVSLPNSSVATVQGKYPPTSLANYTHQAVMDWGNRFIGSTSAPDPAFACAGAVIKAIRDAGVKYGGEEKVKSASDMLIKKSGDCGSVTTLFEAGVLGSGYNARMLVGWNIDEGVPKRHAHAEVSARGYWAPVEPTFGIEGGNPLNFVGNGPVSGNQNFFTFHFGCNVSNDFKDLAGEVRAYSGVNLQVPKVVFATADGPRADRIWFARGTDKPSIKVESF